MDSFYENGCRNKLKVSSTVNENSGFSAIYEALVKGNPVPKMWTLLVLNSEKEYLKVGHFIFSLYKKFLCICKV